MYLPLGHRKPCFDLAYRIATLGTEGFPLSPAWVLQTILFIFDLLSYMVKLFFEMYSVIPCRGEGMDFLLTV